MQQVQPALPLSSRPAVGNEPGPHYGLQAVFAEGPSFSQLTMAVAELFKAVSCALREEREDAEQSIERVAMLLRLDEPDVSETVASPTPDPSTAGPVRSGLAPWQMRKAKMHIELNLGGKVSTQDLATIAGLSPFHFSRAFRNSFGDSPHRYLLRRRIEFSQGLMLSTKDSLAEIALNCGLVDQAHFGKLFRRLVGESPGAWRRARSNEDLAPPPHVLRSGPTRCEGIEAIPPA
jgi:AraC-like DNA-binding protein